MYTITASHPQSHPTRGAWIEIGRMGITRLRPACRTLPGVRGLKLSKSAANVLSAVSRTLPGVRGLKSTYNATNDTGIYKSHPTRGAWIEMDMDSAITIIDGVAPYPGCVD